MKRAPELMTTSTHDVLPPKRSVLGPGVAMNLASLAIRGGPAMDPEVFDLLSPARDLYGGKKESLR